MSYRSLVGVQYERLCNINRIVCYCDGDISFNWVYSHCVKFAIIT